MATYTMEIDGVIDAFQQSVVADQLRFAPVETTTLQVNIASRGGDYMAALAIYNSLRESRKRVITAAQGFVASAGAVVLLAGDEIHAAPNSVIMFHMPEYAGSEPKNAEEMAKIIENLDVASESLITSLCGRTKKSRQEMKNFLQDEVWLTAEKAMDMGFIDKILPFKRRKVSVTNDAPVEIVNFVEDQNKEVERMTLLNLCETFSINIEKEADDEKITNAITTHFRDLEKRLEDQAKAIETPTVPASAADDKISDVKLPAALLNMVKRARETEIDGLIGKITPSVANALKATWTDEARIQNAVDADGNILDGFEDTIDALRKNETVLNLDDSTTGVQHIPKTKSEDNPLLRDAEDRAKAGR